MPSSPSSLIKYANVALDIEARELRDRLFAYKIPEHLWDEVYIGSQVLVPFGNQNSIGGYVVSITDDAPEELKEVKRVRNISEVIDGIPLFDDRYIDFLNWLAFTSCASLADVIAAALPSFLAPRLKRRVKLSALGLSLPAAIQSGPRARLLSLLKSGDEARELSFSSVKQRFLKLTGASQAVFYKEINSLKNEGLVEILTDGGSQMKAKTLIQISPGESSPETKRQKEIVKILAEAGGFLAQKDLIEKAKTTHATLAKLCKSGILKQEEVEVIRDPLPSIKLERKQPDRETLKLTDAQSHCLEILTKELSGLLQAKKEGRHSPAEDPVKPWLLHGVTGSGKTEVYLRLVEKVLQENMSALILVPEISLTPQLASLLVSRFGDTVAIWHSAISPGERLDTWRRLKTGSARVLLGARSAVLADLKDLALIILDEEHDSSYKQTSPSPRYNARAVALEKARREGALIILGSATPDLVTYHEASKQGRILSLPERVFKQAMPAVHVVDMRKELNLGNRSIFSRQLARAIEERLTKKEQIILLMNRRGYASHVFCRACGYVARCKNCSVSLVFHRYTDKAMAKRLSAPDPVSGIIEIDRTPKSMRGFLACHHCGTSKNLSIQCPECQSPFLKEYGLGTQKVEETIAEQFPAASTVRLDSDVTTKRGEFKRVLDRFNRGEADILIGTQMVAKGLDVPNVTLVGVLAADASLNMPDYRSTERGYQLLSQVAGRAGRGVREGEVIFQTYNPELQIFDWARKHDFEAFFETELANRETFSYPPYSRILRVVVSGAEAEEVESECASIVGELKDFIETTGSPVASEILGPAPCIIERLRGSFRYHILIKVKDDDPAFDQFFDGLLILFRTRKNRQEVRVIVDVDALDLL
ncbi:MAG: primosomal protein N' [Cyanobacteria bacterium HKST-UBA01]|nr:primosomal protein N' [Cyanobacteria bacterium HKST-UBA01]